MHLVFTLSMMSKTLYTVKYLNRILNFAIFIVFVYNLIMFKIMLQVKSIWIIIVFDVQIINFLLCTHKNSKP